MTRAAAVAALALVLIGTVEAMESAREIAEATGPLRLTPGGAGVTSLGLLASCAVYVALGWRIGNERAALRAGALAGFIAGILGGTLRAVVIDDVVEDAVRRYADVPDWFVPTALGVFVVGAVGVSVIAGAALAFIGARLRSGPIRSGPNRPPA